MVLLPYVCDNCKKPGGWGEGIMVEANAILLPLTCLECGHKGLVHLEVYFQVKDTLEVGDERGTENLRRGFA